MESNMPMGAGTSSRRVIEEDFLSQWIGRNLILNNDLALNKAYLRGEYVVPNHGLKKIIFVQRMRGRMIRVRWINIVIIRNFVSHYEQGIVFSDDRAGEKERGKILPVGAEERIGVRVKTLRTHLGRIPIAGRHSPSPSTWLHVVNYWFGSRGLIHHALVSRMVVDAALNDDPSMIPQELSINNCI